MAGGPATNLRHDDRRDRYGFDMSAKTPQGPRPIRVAFESPATTPDELRAALVAKAKDARSRLD